MKNHFTFALVGMTLVTANANAEVYFSDQTGKQISNYSVAVEKTRPGYVKYTLLVNEKVLRDLGKSSEYSIDALSRYSTAETKKAQDEIDARNGHQTAKQLIVAGTTIGGIVGSLAIYFKVAEGGGIGAMLATPLVAAIGGGIGVMGGIAAGEFIFDRPNSPNGPEDFQMRALLTSPDVTSGKNHVVATPSELNAVDELEQALNSIP